MITITKELTITSGVAPYTYTWINNSPCANVLVPTGVSVDGSISTDITFFDESCLNTASIKLFITDSAGCSKTFDVILTSPCTSMVVAPIQYQGDFTFSIAVSGGSPSYTYNWLYDASKFNKIASASSVLQLAPLAPITSGSSTTVTCIVSDSKGCSQTKTYSLNFCPPSATPKYVSLICDSLNNEASKSHVQLSVTTCAGSTIDWTTLAFSGFPSGITIAKGNHPNEPNAVDVSADLDTVPTGNYSGYYTITNSYGVQATAEFVIYVPVCASPSSIYGIAHTVNMPCPSTAGASIAVNLEDYVFSTLPINWATFAFNPLTGQSSPSQFQLNGVLGTATVSLAHVLTYTLTATTSATEIIQWAVCNSAGTCVANITLTIINACPAAPVAVNDSFCAVCGQSTAYLTITSNDTGTFSPGSVQIVTQPSNGSVTVASNGTISYSANASFSGVDTLTYTVTNYITGQTSNAATVTFTVICAGNDGVYTACN